MASKYKALYEELKDQIVRGAIKPGAQLPAQRELARQRSIHVMTAARALEELARAGYVVREVGRGTFVQDPLSWRTGPGREKKGVRNIALILVRCQQDQPGYSELLGCILDAATSNNCALRLWKVQGESYSDEDRDAWKACDGLIVTGTAQQSVVLEIAWLGVPLVLIGASAYPEQLAGRVGHVDIRYDRGAEVAVEHLIALGHCRIGLGTGGTPEDRRHTDFREGYRAALAWHHIQFDPELVHVCADPSNDPCESIAGRRVARRLLSLSKPPTAIVCVTDTMAYGVCAEAAGRGLSIPRDLSVTGQDDLLTSRDWTPPLTALHTWRRERGETAVELLISQINNPKQECRTILFEPKLIKRGSTGAAPAVS